MSPTLFGRQHARQVKLTGLSLLLLLISCAWTNSSHAQTRPPILISEPTSTRAIALETVSLLREPFKLTSPLAWSPDQRTRVTLFALNLSLQPGENLSVVTADAEDGAHRRYPLQVEYVGPVPGQSWMSAVIIRLSDDLTNVGDVLVRVAYRGSNSNRVRLSIGQMGGGLPDDSGAAPTPAPPYLISGQVTFGGVGLGGVSVTLSGPQTQTITTAGDGSYSFTAATADDYTLALSKLYYNFTPSSRSFSTLSNHQPNINFAATRQVFTISGQVRDDSSQGLGGIEVALLNQFGGLLRTVVSGAGGNFSFADVPAGLSYAIAPTTTNVFTFSAQTTGTLGGHLTLNFSGLRRTYTIYGRVTDAPNHGLGGVAVNLGGAQAAVTTTDGNGNYFFAGLPAGRNYALTTSRIYYDLSPQSQTFNNLSGDQEANFNGALSHYLISGRVLDDQGQGLVGTEVVLLNEIGGSIRTVLTGAGGSFSFPDLTASYSYTVAPTSNNFLAFNTQNTGALGGNLSLDFRAVRRTYTIYGRVTDAPNHGLGGATLTLTGSQAVATTTNNDGNYSFTGLPAGGNYQVVAAKDYYDISPQGQSLNNLGANQEANFTSALRHYIISGRVLDDSGQELDGIEVKLNDEAGGTLRTAIAGTGGNFSFSDVPAGQNYTVALTSTSLFNFNAQNTGALGGNLTLSFSGVRRLYTIHGRVTDAPDHGLGGVTVNLSGSQTLTTTTNDDGNYSLAGLPAGGIYAVTPAKAYYNFSPANQTFPNLGDNQNLDFNGALRPYLISGRVTDTNGNGIVGVAINLSGSQTSTVRTGSDGSYTLSAAATGNYTVTPAIEQDSYLFAPSNQSFSNLINDQTAGFTATLAPIPEPSYVLEFDGGLKTVDYGDYWEPYLDQGHFFWEFWAMPGNNAGATYLLSDGFGGAHALLFGFSNLGISEPGRYELFGDTFDGYVSGQHVVFFSSDQGPAPGEWGHFAVGWDGQNIITYFNGVPVGKTAFTGPRQTPSPGHGGNKLLIGGSDHNNLNGRIAQVRGYEGRNPLADNGAVEAAFAPQTVFGIGGNLLSYFFRPAPKVADLSRGHDGIGHPGATHVGTPRGTLYGVLYDCGACPPPRFVIDPTAPDFAQNIAPQPVAVATPPPVPGGARVFDSFSRANSTYLFNGRGGLGSTEGGIAGPKAWLTDQDASQPQPFGILNGRAVLLANSTHLAWIPGGNSTGDLDVRVDRHPGTWGSGLDTGLSFRVVDAGNFFFAYTVESSNPNAPRNLTVGYYRDGIRTDLLTGLALPTYWTTLRVVTKNDGSIKVYADAMLVYSTTNNLMETATGAGLYNNAPGLGLVNRWDNFTITDAP